MVSTLIKVKLVNRKKGKLKQIIVLYYDINLNYLNAYL